MPHFKTNTVKFFSANKGQIATLITLLVMVFLGACYLFIYIPANEKNVQGQRFRSLQNIDRNIHTKIDNSIAMLDLLIRAYNDEPKPRKTIINYITNYSTQNFKLTKPVLLDKKVLVNRDSIDFYDIQINNATSDISLLNQKVIINQPDTAIYQMSMLFKIEQFIKMLLPENVFDEYIVFSNGKPVYETFPSGISAVKDDSLLRIENGVSGSVMRKYNVSGTEYKLFLQPVNFGRNEWIIAGLLTEKRYNEEKNQLPAQVVLLLVTIVLIIVLFFPWIKLYPMGSKDRLTLTDAVSTVVISMLLVSLMFFMFFKYNVPFRTTNAPKEKSKLAASIIKAFKRETDTAYHKLKAFDSLVDSAASDIINLGTPSISYKNNDSIAIANKINSISNGLAIKQLYWLNPKGDEVINWNADTVNGPHGNFKNRPYFNVIQNGRPYLLNKSDSQIYYLDQLVSRTTGSFTTVISIPSRYKLSDTGRYVAGMSFNVKSLQQAVLPTGFKFSLIDNSGKVLYHSDVTKCLNENLLSEFSESDKLKSCLEARSEGFFTTGYFSNDYYVHIRPINDLPYFVVILEDAGFKETRDMEVYSFTFSFMLLFFAFMIVQMMITFIVSSRRSFFKKQVFNTSWIGPKKSAHRQYNLAIIANGSVILLLLIFYHFASFLLFGFMLLFSVTFLSLFLNAVFARRYKSLKPANYSFKLNSIRWLFACVIIIDLFAIITLETKHVFLLLLFELIAFAIGIPLYMQGDRVLNEVRAARPALINKYNYIHSFTLMAFTRLIVSSGIPVMFLYITAYNYEQNLDIRYKQLQFARNVVKKLSSSQLNSAKNGFNYQSGIYLDSTWIKEATVVKEDSLKKVFQQYTAEDRRALTLLNLFRLHITDKAINDDKFYMDKAGDSSFYHNHLLKDACSKDCGTITAVQTNIPGQYFQVTSGDLNYHFPGILCREAYCKGLLYWLLLFGGLALFYFILLNIIKKIFTLNIPDLTRWQGLDNEILESTKLNNLVFVIGLPGSGKLSRVLEDIEAKKIVSKTGEPYAYDKTNDAASNVFIADLMNIPDAGDERSNDAEWKFYVKKIFNSKNRLVIINHFEYNIQDAYTTRIKLNLLENIMVQNSCRVIILSTIHPVAFLESVLDHAHKGSASVPGQDLERWHVLLGHFRIVIFPLEERKEEGIQSRLEQAISYEARRTHFLNKMLEATIKVATAMPVKYSVDREADELAFKLQMTSHYFYMYMWQSLTKEEKFLLYDHAEDNLVNSFDDYNLNMLICKGVLIRSDGALRIFNNGFRNFILTAIGNTEAMKIKNQIKDNGNWNKLKNPMLIVILAIMVFLIASQQEAYSKLITYAAALATGIPVVMKIFSLFDGTKEKSM